MAKVNLRGMNANQIGLLIAVLAIYFFCPTQGIFSAAMGEIHASYPEVPEASLTYLITINNVMAIPAAFFFGILAGRVFKFKTLAIIALVLFTVGGGLPVFLPTDSPYWILFMTRGLLGLGRGCFIPIVQITLSAMFTEKKTRAAWFGIGSIFFNIGGTCGIAIAGLLAMVDWRFCFAFYLFAAIPLILYSIFFKEEDVKDYIASSKMKLKALRFPATCWAYLILYALAIVISQVMFNYAGLAMTHLGISPAHIGLALSCFTIAATVVGVFFSFIYRVCSNYIIALGIAIMTIGMFVFFSACFGGGSIPLFYGGAVVIGIGCTLVTIGCPLSMSLTVAPVTVAAALSFNEVFHNIGAFLASPWAQIVYSVFPDAGTDFIFLATAILGCVLTVIAFFVSTVVKRHAQAIQKGEKELESTVDLNELDTGMRDLTPYNPDFDLAIDSSDHTNDDASPTSAVSNFDSGKPKG